MGSAASEVIDIGRSRVEAAVGRGAFDRGLDYARRGRVLRLAWEGEGSTLSGSVVGQGGLYRTVAFFEADARGAMGFVDGECTCPVGYNCKHVAALVLAAQGKPLPSERRPA